MAHIISHIPIASKRSRFESGALLHSEPKLKRQHVNHSGEHISGNQLCDELRILLLKKVGVNVDNTDPAAVDEIFSEQYSPRIQELIDSISTTLDQAHLPPIHCPDKTSDISESSDDETYAVVPAPEDPLKAILNDKSDYMVPAPPKPRATTVVRKVVGPKEEPNVVPAVAAYKGDTEIAISRIFDLGKVTGVADPTISADAPYHGPSVITMTGFGELGRFGNQMFQYAFMKCYATRHGISEIQVPSWVGAGLFGLADRPVQRALPPVVEFRETLANSTFTTEFIDYVLNSNEHENVQQLDYDALGSHAPCLKNVDMWGWYQWHTSVFSPYKDVIQKTFTPIPTLKQSFDKIFSEKVRYMGGVRRTVVGLHMRLGDYQSISMSSFGYCAPASWYLSWLQEIWPTLDNPVLLVASDDLDAVLKEFAAFKPLTAESIGLHMPEEMKALRAGFFPDWFSLTQCDVLAISNSTFSFSACMMNQQANARFYRAHFTGVMEKIDPWNADPIVHRDLNKAKLASLMETLQVVYNTQGSRGLVKNLLYEMPLYGLRSGVMKAVLWRKGLQGC